MRKLLRLVRQSWRAAWKIYAAAVLLTALTVAAYLIYQSNMDQLGARFSQQVKDADLLADLYVELPLGQLLAEPVQPTGSWKARPTPQLAAAGRSLPVNTPYGQLTLLAIQPDAAYAGPLPEPGTVLINQVFATNLGLPSSGKLLLSSAELESEVTLVIDGSFQASAHSGHLLALADGLPLSLATSAYNIFLYELADDLTLKAARTTLAHFYPAAFVFDGQFAQLLAQQTLEDSYQGFAGLELLFFTFLTLGLLTAFLLAFLDSKRELSVLKSLGLAPRELGTLFVLNSLVSAGSGLLLGTGLAFLSSSIMQMRGVLLSIKPQYLLPASGRVGLAYCLAVAIPANLAWRATVNQLLYDQTIPLISRRVTALRKRYVTLEDKLAQGWQLLQLPVIDGVLEGFIFKKVGDQVKKGEVLAFAPSWWGLAYTEYVATIDGEVGMWQESSGFLGIKPLENRNTPPQ